MNSDAVIAEMIQSDFDKFMNDEPSVVGSVIRDGCVKVILKVDASHGDGFTDALRIAPGVFDAESAPDGQVTVYILPDGVGEFTDWISRFMQVPNER